MVLQSWSPKSTPYKHLWTWSVRPSHNQPNQAEQKDPKVACLYRKLSCLGSKLVPIPLPWLWKGRVICLIWAKGSQTVVRGILPKRLKLFKKHWCWRKIALSFAENAVIPKDQSHFNSEMVIIPTNQPIRFLILNLSKKVTLFNFSTSLPTATQRRKKQTNKQTNTHACVTCGSSVGGTGPTSLVPVIADWEPLAHCQLVISTHLKTQANMDQYGYYGPVKGGLMELFRHDGEGGWDPKKCVVTGILQHLPGDSKCPFIP